MAFQDKAKIASFAFGSTDVNSKVGLRDQALFTAGHLDHQSRSKWNQLNFIVSNAELQIILISRIGAVVVKLGVWLGPLVIGLKHSRNVFSQPEVRAQPIATHPGTFSCSPCRLHVLAKRYRIYGFSASFVTVLSDNFGFAFTTLSWKLLFQNY